LSLINVKQIDSSICVIRSCDMNIDNWFLQRFEKTIGSYMK